MKYFILIFSLFILSFESLHADETEEWQVSLLTVMPSNKAIYTIYGHSALRLYLPQQHINTVYNWGTFDFNAPHFLYRFLKGNTDYFLSSFDYDSFLQLYHSLHVTVIEQILSISSEGKKRLLQKISQNLKPENRIYRYNFLKDNCTTRIRDLIEDILNNSLDTFDRIESRTFRQWIHAYTAPYRWMTFGIDLLIGSEADQSVSQREALFLPMNLKEKLTHCRYKSGSPLVVSSRHIIQSEKNEADYSSFILSPAQLGWILVCFYGVLFIVLGIYCYLKITIPFNALNAIDNSFAFLFFVYALAGSLVLFFVLFSSHPCTSYNWNLLWLHPFHFVAFIGCFFKRPFRWIIGYHGGNILLSALLLIGKTWLPQDLNSEIVPYVFCSMIVSLLYLTKEKIWKLHESNR